MAENVLKPVEVDDLSAGGELSGDWRPLETLRREIDRLFQDIETGKSLIRPSCDRTIFDFEPFSRGDSSLSSIPPVDIVEKDTCFEISAELPGVNPQDIEVNVNSDTLRIKGEKKEVRENNDQKQDFHLSERRFGVFQRTFRFPEQVDSDKIEASFNEGVLTVILPKSAEPQPPGKNIPIKTS